MPAFIIDFSRLFSAVIVWFTIEADVIGEADQVQLKEFR